jgi:SAM-dependent methyltransferase
MKWLVKAFIQKAVSFFPKSESLNFFFQHKVTKSLPADCGTFCHKVKIAVEHFNAFLRYGTSKDISRVAFYEFGAGWDLIIPLAYYAFGIDHQTLVDIRPNLRFELINDSLKKFSKQESGLDHATNRLFNIKIPSQLETVPDLKTRFGITYLAPLNAGDTGFPPGSFDFISSTVTLNLIPEPDLLGILKECNRILKNNGIMSCRISMLDDYSSFDKSISHYNFLKYSNSVWEYINSPLHFQNRLRYSDYIRLIKVASMEIIAENLEKPTSEDMQILNSLNISPEFKEKYSLEDLGAKRLKIVLRKAGL